MTEDAPPPDAPAPSPGLLLALAGAAGLAALGAWALLAPEGPGAFLAAHFLVPVEAQAALTGEARYSAPAFLGYGAVLALALGGVHALLLERLRMPVDRSFFVILSPFLVWGPVARALQDSGYLLGPDLEPLPFSWLLVEPLVYLTTALLALLALLWWRVVGAMPDRRVQAAASLGLLLAVGLAEVVLFTRATFAHPLSPGTLAAGFAVAVAAWLGARRRDAGLAAGLSLAVLLLAPVLGLALTWALAAAPPWAPPSAWAGNHPAAVPVAAGAAAVAGLAVTGGVRALARFRLPAVVAGAGTLMGGLLVFGHVLDAASTLLAINDPLGWGLPRYGENNPVSAGLLSVAWGAPFLLVKILLPAGVAGVLHQEARKPQERDLALFLALVVFALGFGPGARNLARLAMGV